MPSSSSSSSSSSSPSSSSSKKGNTNNNNNMNNNNNKNVFLTPEGGITPTLFLLLIGAPLLISGQFFYGGIICIVAIIVAIKAAMEDIQEIEKQEIRYNILEPQDLLAELEELFANSSYSSTSSSSEDMNKTTTTSSDNNNDNNDNGNNYNDNHNFNYEQKHAKCLASLSALAKKYNHRKSNNRNNNNNTDNNNNNNNLGLICQRAAYLSLQMFPDDDEIVAGSISLLALIAKDRQVRKRNKFQADIYGFDIPIKCLQKALERAKQIDNDNNNENNENDDDDEEEVLAEILRKGCLYMGAIADDDDQELDLALKIVEEDGLELIINAANWFRYHEGVANWSLWAMFILGYDSLPNKIQLIRLGGITTICQLLENNSTSLEVNRHGVAILFDLLREGQQQGQGQQQQKRHANIKFDPWEVRRIALSAGLHKVLLNAMTEFSDSMDIMMMSQEMLIGTGYRGDIPQYQQP